MEQLVKHWDPRQAGRQAEKARTVDRQAPKAGLMVEEVCKQPR